MFSHIIILKKIDSSKRGMNPVDLTHYQMTNFRLFQAERVCRRQFQIWRKWKKVIQTGRKHCGKRRNCSLWAISPFPTIFSKVSLCGNGLNDQSSERILAEPLEAQTSHFLFWSVLCYRPSHRGLGKNKWRSSKTLWEKENAGNQQFPLLLTMFCTSPKTNLITCIKVFTTQSGL